MIYNLRIDCQIEPKIIQRDMSSAMTDRDASPGNKRIILVYPHGFCAGVERAVKTAELMLKEFHKPVYCLKQIVHNQQIVDRLSAEEMIFLKDIRDVPRGSPVLFSAHGVPPEVPRIAKEMDLTVIDATCPFVSRLHTELLRYVKRGFHVIMIGHRTHDEVVGVAGEAPEHVTVVESVDEAEKMVVSNPGKIAVLTQTTLSMDEVARILDTLKRRFPTLEMPADHCVCYATRHRQDAVRAISVRADIFIVLGTANSSNSNRLVEVARSRGCKAALVSSLDQLADVPLEGVMTIGLTAGASTPESYVDATIDALKARGFHDVERVTVVQEDVHFALPSGLKKTGN
jgi:4-hydroxy-3-methylbut-2-enyl diphosphate reductase